MNIIEAIQDRGPIPALFPRPGDLGSLADLP